MERLTIRNQNGTIGIGHPLRYYNYDDTKAVFCRLAAYEDTNLEPAEVVKAKKENRILPEEFACLTLSDGKTLAAWYPKGKNVAVQRHENYELSERKELTEDD